MDLRDISEPGWRSRLEPEFAKDYFQALALFLRQKEQGGQTIYPPASKIYNAFVQTPFQKVRTVILGQDPYINPGQAMGLAFSVPEGCTPPPSLKNIYAELEQDIENFSAPAHGDLTAWARQGVLLLNSVLSVDEGASASHARKGWERFTDQAILSLEKEREGIVFLLWGNYAKKKGAGIDRRRHLVLEAGHPSPLSVRYFRGCRHFSKTNHYLTSNGKQPIDWRI